MIELEVSINTKTKNIFEYEYSECLDDWLKFFVLPHLEKVWLKPLVPF